MTLSLLKQPPFSVAVSDVSAEALIRGIRTTLGHGTTEFKVSQESEVLQFLDCFEEGVEQWAGEFEVIEWAVSKCYADHMVALQQTMFDEGCLPHMGAFLAYFTGRQPQHGSYVSLPVSLDEDECRIALSFLKGAHGYKEPDIWRLHLLDRSRANLYTRYGTVTIVGFRPL